MLTNYMLTILALFVLVSPTSASKRDRDELDLISGRVLSSTILVADAAAHDPRSLPFPGNSLDVRLQGMFHRDLNQLIVNHMDGRTALRFSAVSAQAFRLVLNRNKISVHKNIPDWSALCLIRENNNLISLDISLDLQSTEQLSDHTLLTIAQRCRNLRRLSINGCANMTDIVVIAFAKNNPCIDQLKVSDCEKLTNSSLEALAMSPNLKMLKIPGRLATDLFVMALSINGQKLRELNLTNGESLTNASMKAIGAGCTNLTILELTGCFQLGDDGIIQLARCRKMDTLALGNCAHLNDLTIKTLASGCPDLKKLMLWGQNLITDEAIVALANGCRKLQEIIIRSCSRLTNRSLVALLGCCPDLSELNMENCGELDDGAFIELNGPIANKLRLNISSCPLLTDSGSALLAMKIPHLYALDLSKCPLISDATVRSLSEYCRDLAWLSLSGCGEITDDTVRILTPENLPKLNFLNLFHNPKITLPYKIFNRTE